MFFTIINFVPAFLSSVFLSRGWLWTLFWCSKCIQEMLWVVYIKFLSQNFQLREIGYQKGLLKISKNNSIVQKNIVQELLWGEVEMLVKN